MKDKKLLWIDEPAAIPKKVFEALKDFRSRSEILRGSPPIKGKFYPDQKKETKK